MPAGPRRYCDACSKPIRPRAATRERDGRLFHLRCLAHETKRRALELQSAAREAARESQALLGQARALLSAGARRLRCATCHKAILGGAGWWRVGARGEVAHLTCPRPRTGGA